MSGVAIAAVAAVSAVSVGYTIYSGEKARTEQHKAQDRAQESALKQEKANEEAMNRANRKKPDTNAIMQATQSAAGGGVGGTMLTGPQGIANDSLSLGKSTLLGS